LSMKPELTTIDARRRVAYPSSPPRRISPLVL
jgi:hypothetical protein